MILRRIAATSFQRYKQLSIDKLPERGVIGVIGENESGKSSIGDAVSFAFFGRTLRVGAERIQDVIHWKADSASVKVAFSTGDGKEYEVLREVDREESYFAQLTDLGSGEVVARGVGKVQRKLDRLIGWGFEEFRHSFHLGQKDFDVFSGDADSERRQRILDEMVGIHDIEAAGDTVRGEVENLRAEIARIEREQGFTERILGEYADLAQGTDPIQARLDDATKKIQELEKSLGATQADRVAGEQHRGHHQDAVSAVEAFKVRAYAHLLQRSTEGLRAGLSGVGEAIRELENEQRLLSAQLEAHREFTPRVDELEALVKARADELNRELKNNLEGVYSEADGDLITPDGKREQLVITEKRIGETEARTIREKARGTMLMWVGIALLGMAAAVVFLLPAQAAGLHYAAMAAPLTLGVGALVLSKLAHNSAKELERKRSRLDMNRSILQEEVGRIRRSLEACQAFARGEPGTWAERVRLIESPRIRELYERIVARHLDLLTPGAMQSGFAEAIAEKARMVQQSIANKQRERSDMETFLSWLATTSTTLATSALWPRISGEGAIVPWTYDIFKAEKNALVAAAGEAARRLYALEALGQGRAGDEPVSVLRQAFAGLVAAGKSERGREPDAAFYDELSRLATGSWEGGAEALAVRLRRVDHEIASFLPALTDLESRLADAASRRESLLRELESARLSREAINGELKKVEPDVARNRQLTEERSALDTRRAEIGHQLKVREALLAMFEELKDALRRRCGPAIGEFMAWVLPQLTQGRYSSVKLSDELAIRVFAPEKGDFVGLDQLSGGTSDQMLLALRLAFSKALIFTRKSPEFQQYLFLDEPFSSFDEKRAAAFVDLLKQPDPNFAQVFVVSHLPGLETACDLLIRTTIQQTELVVN